MPTTMDIRAIYLGTHSDLDPDERYLGAENARSLIGTTFGSATDPLARSILPLTLHDGNSNNSVAFNTRAGSSSSEYLTDADGTRHYLDSGAIYSGTVTYLDGTTANNVPLRILQDTNGNLVLLPPPSNASANEVDGVTTKPIETIHINSVIRSDFNGLDISRYGLTDAPAFICFCRGTRILTDRGEVLIEDLRIGDMVMTRDNGPQPLRWSGAKKVEAPLLALFTKMRPVRIAVGALGKNVPRDDLYISQQHRILVSSKIAERMFGESEVLIAAKHLTEIDGIDIVADGAPVEYFHLLFDRHEIICSQGAQTESLFTGQEALKSVDPAAKAEILALFPELVAEVTAREPARRIGSGREGRQLAKRHAVNGHQLQNAATT